MTSAATTYVRDTLRLVVYPDAAAAGAAAASAAATVIRAAIEERGEARVVFAAAPSQDEFLRHLREEHDVDWRRVHAFHMDEYIGLPPGAPQSFAQWLTDRLPSVRFDTISPDPDPENERRRYAHIIAAEPLDLTCLGAGVNGHIAFNEPGQCRFDDPETVRVITLDEASRQQQVDDELFDAVDAVPRTAITMTVPALLSASALVGIVPGRHKADAVASLVSAPVSPTKPVTALRTHPNVTVYVDADAASLVQS